VLFRSRAASAHVIAALIVGVLWLGAATMILHVRINFANFIAFPITFGIGVDYAVNIVSRYVQDKRRGILDAVRLTGSAVVLSSLTTIIGYSSLLLAENRALFLFGLVAVFGEIACLLTATTFMPAVLLLGEARRNRIESAGPGGGVSKQGEASTRVGSLGPVGGLRAETRGGPP
jgi:predicted RND superfamily exporter protein